MLVGFLLLQNKYKKQDHDEASFPCPQCPHLAKSKHRLTKHIYDVHKLQERKILMKDEPVVRPVCDICAESFSTKGALKTHIKGKKDILKCMFPKAIEHFSLIM